MASIADKYKNDYTAFTELVAARPSKELQLTSQQLATLLVTNDGNLQVHSPSLVLSAETVRDQLIPWLRQTFEEPEE